MSVVDPPLSLRAVADRLVHQKLTAKSDKKGFDKLLGVLKTGQIRAVVTFPDVSSEPLIVSEHYWQKRGPDAIRSLLNIPDKGRHGTYTVKLSDVATEAYQKAARQKHELSPEQLAVSLIQQAGTRASVEVLESEWRRYLESLKLSISDDSDEASGPGRQKKNWEAVYHELAALLWVYIGRPKAKLPKHGEIVATVIQGLEALGKEDIPGASTVRDRLAGVRARVKQLRKGFREKPIE